MDSLQSSRSPSPSAFFENSDWTPSPELIAVINGQNGNLGGQIVGVGVQIFRAYMEYQVAQAQTSRYQAEAEAQQRMREELEERLAHERELRELGIQPDREVSTEEIEQARRDANFINGHFHVVVTGNRGSGKSSLINALLGYTATDPRAAPTGTVETTMTRGRFVDSRHQGHIWYDVPGAGTANITAWQYYYSQRLYIYDLVVVLHETTLTEADIQVLKVCKHRNQPFVVARSKSDQHIWNTHNSQELDPRAAREHYIAAARQDSSRAIRFGGEVLDVTDLLISARTVRAIINGENFNDWQGNPLRELIDEIELLRRLGVSPAVSTPPLILYNHTAQKSHDLAASLPPGSSRVVSSLKEGISQADIIFTCLSNDSVVESTYQSIISDLTATPNTPDDLSGRVFIGMETIHPDTADKLASLLASHGAEFIACPVLGPPAAAAAGQLIAFPAGSQAALSRAMPYITGGIPARAAITFPDRPCGTSPSMKIIANTFTLNAAVQLAEAFALAEKIGIEPEQVGRFVEECLVGSRADSGTNPFHVYAGRMLRGDYWKKEPAGGVAMGFKDAGLAVRLAGENRATVRNPLNAMGWCQEVLKGDGTGRGKERGDIAGIYGVVREKAGLRFQNDG